MPTLKELRSQHRNIIQMAFNGYKNNEIAERLGMAQSSVSIILRSPLGQAYMNGLQDRAQEATLDVRKKLVSLNKDALDTIARLLNPKEKAPHSVQFSAAKDVLDRTGYKAPDRLNVDMTFQTKTDEELDAEISAIEASVNRTNNRKDLPKVESHQVCESQINSNPPIINDVSNLIASSSLVTSTIVSDNDDDDLSLEDSLDSESYYINNFDDEDLAEDEISFNASNYEDAHNLGESISLEDKELLNNFSFDPFHNIKRS